MEQERSLETKRLSADASPSELAAVGGQGLSGAQLWAGVPAGAEREMISLRAEDGAMHDGAVYRPVGRKRNRTGVILMHPAATFLQHYALGPLAALGFTTLGIMPRFRAESSVIMETVLLDLASGIRYMRDTEKCERIVLVGNSGGGGLMAFYQGQAENPTVRCTPAGDPPDLVTADLPPADALVFLNAHPGRPQVLASYLDPSVVDERDPVATDPELDMFNPENGPPFSAEFIERYRAAQIARSERITAWARKRLKELESTVYTDEAFVVHRTTAALEMRDLAVDPSDRPVGWYGGDAEGFNRSSTGIGRFVTLRTWLSQFGLSSSNALAEPNLAQTSVPVLVMQSTADEGVYPAHARGLYAAAATSDKELYWIKGGSHFFAGQPDLQQEMLDHLVGWLSDRGLA